MKTFSFIATVLTPPPSVMTCSFQMIYSVGPFKDWEVMENWKWLCRWQGVTQGNVIRAPCIAPSFCCRSHWVLSSHTSISQVVVKNIKETVLDLMSWRQSPIRCVNISASLLSLSLQYQPWVRQSDRYKLIKQISLFLSQASLQLLVRVSLKAVLGAT